MLFQRTCHSKIVWCLRTWKKQKKEDRLFNFNEFVHDQGRISCFFCIVIFGSTFSQTVFLFPSSPINGAARIFSYYLMPQPGFEPTSESCTSFWEAFKGTSYRLTYRIAACFTGSIIGRWAVNLLIPRSKKSSNLNSWDAWYWSDFNERNHNKRSD